MESVGNVIKQVRIERFLSNPLVTPDVHIDEKNKQIRMYYHGQAKAISGQCSGVATSFNGIDFKASTQIISKFYFRVWNFKGYWYALAKNNNEGYGELYRSEDGLSGFQSRGNFLERMAMLQ